MLLLQQTIFLCLQLGHVDAHVENVLLVGALFGALRLHVLGHLVLSATKNRTHLVHALLKATFVGLTLVDHLLEVVANACAVVHTERNTFVAKDVQPALAKHFAFYKR